MKELIEIREALDAIESHTDFMMKNGADSNSFRGVNGKAKQALKTLDTLIARCILHSDRGILAQRGVR